MVSSKERRRFSRFIIQLPVRYQTRSPENGELQQGQGFISNISLSGSLFQADRASIFQPGQSLSLTIAAPGLFPENDPISNLIAAGKVVRLEPPGFANPNGGVAVSFFKNLSFAMTS